MLHRLRVCLSLPVPLDRVFAFFADVRAVEPGVIMATSALV